MVKMVPRMNGIMERVEWFCPDMKIGEAEVSRKIIQSAIELEVGADPRTINNHERLLIKYGFIQPINQYAYRVMKLRFNDGTENMTLNDFGDDQISKRIRSMKS